MEGWESRAVNMRRMLHQTPEVAFEEFRTCEIVMQRLKEIRECYRWQEKEFCITRCGSTGITVDLVKDANDPLIAFRADLDALPIEENTGLRFSSQNPGKHHACGHDGHISQLIGLCELITSHPIEGLSIRLIFQPAEEIGKGALDIISHNCLEKVLMIFGGHIDPFIPVGTIVVQSGCVNASMDNFNVNIKGKGGHGARPHQTKDALVAGAALVLNAQKIVSRNVDPGKPCVITFGSFHSGGTFNAIPGECVLTGTIRSTSDEIRNLLLKEFENVCSSIGTMYGVEIGISYISSVPPLINKDITLCKNVAESLGKVGQLESVNMGSEDFAYYLQKIPGVYVRFGASIPNASSAHSAEFDFNEDVISMGSLYYFNVAQTFLSFHNSE